LEAKGDLLGIISLLFLDDMFFQELLSGQDDLLFERNHPLLHAGIAIVQWNIPQ